MKEISKISETSKSKVSEEMASPLGGGREGANIAIQGYEGSFSPGCCSTVFWEKCKRYYLRHF